VTLPLTSFILSYVCNLSLFCLIFWISAVFVLYRDQTLKTMRIIHTADWHLGRILHNVSLLEDQQQILEQLKIEIMKDLPDALIIAGDIYDKAIPSEGAVRL